MKTLTKLELSAALNVSRPTLDAWIRDGLPVLATPVANRRFGYQFDLPTVRRWIKKRDAAIQAARPSLEYRIFEAVHREFWNLSRPLMRPDDLRLVRDGCRDTDDLIRVGYRMGKSIGARLSQLADDMWLAEHPEDAPE